MKNPEDLASRADPATMRPSDIEQAHGLFGSVADLAITAAERYATARKDRLADTVIDIAAAVRRSGRRFEGQQDWLADAIDRGASKVRDMAEDLRDAEMRSLVAQGRVMARERPALFVAGAIAAGVVAASMVQRAIADLKRQQLARAA